MIDGVNIMKNKMIIDGGYMIHRAKTTPGRSELTSKGRKTGMVYGVLCDIRKLLKEGYELEMALDKGKAVHRHKISKNYKSNRCKNTIESFEYKLLEASLKFLGIDQFYHPELEADDVIATRVKNNDNLNYIYTVDKDLYQLIDDDIKVYNPNKNIIDKDKVKDIFGIYPEDVIEFLAIIGDKSDNIKGIKGIGKKTASKYINNEELTERQINLIKDNKNIIKHNKKLIKLKIVDNLVNLTDEKISNFEAEFIDNPDNLIKNGYDYSAFENLIEEYEMKSLEDIVEYLTQGSLSEFV